MFYKLSNAVNKEKIEREFNLQLKYPNLYTQNLIINGLEEENLLILKSQDAPKIDYAIWGMMPTDYKEDWITFQRVNNTLNLELNQIEHTEWLQESFKMRRCLIIVTGFFSYLLKNGIVYPYHVGLLTEKPFFLAGIYNELDDGFISCSLILKKADNFLCKYHNTDPYMPRVISPEYIDFWFSQDSSFEELVNFVENAPTPRLKTNPVAAEFLKQGISYESLLQPVQYDGLPKGEASN